MDSRQCESGEKKNAKICRTIKANKLVLLQHEVQYPTIIDYLILSNMSDCTAEAGDAMGSRIKTRSERRNRAAACFCSGSDRWNC